MPGSKVPELVKLPLAWYFIINPRAGGKSKAGFKKKVKKILGEEHCTFRKTKLQEGAAIGIQKGRQSGYTGFVAVGGDGTINLLAKELRGTDDVLGIVPAGSGNGLAGWLGIKKDLEQNLTILRSGRIIRVDTATVNGIPFINLAGVGFDGAVAHATANSRFRGFWPYILASIRLIFGNIFWKGKIILDGIEYKGEYLDVVIANGAVFGYGFRIARDAKINDGFFTVMLVHKTSRWRYFLSLPTLFMGWKHSFPWLVEIHAKQVTIYPDNPTCVHVDGEGIDIDLPYNFVMHPSSLNLVIPAYE